MILKVHASGPFDTNTYVFGCSKTKQAVIIDVPLESVDWILETLSTQALKATKILLTHSHWDHIAEAALLKERLNLPIYVHPEDAENLQRPGADRLPLFWTIPGVMPDGYFQENQEIRIGDLLLVVIHTPGHTPGSVCLHESKEKILFSGDTLFQGTMGRVDFPLSSPAKMWKSLKKLSLLPPETKVYPGHGEPTRIADEGWIAEAQEKFG
jgi:hydroxyacylglutathione hydrolase